MTTAGNIVDRIMRWEDGSMGEIEEAEFFQYLIDTRAAWTLQGCYGRRAEELIRAGECHRATVRS